MDRSLGFGSMPCNSAPSSDSVSLRLRDFHPLTSLHVMTRRLILQKARRHPSGLRPLAGPWFQVLFHSPPGVLFTFPSRYSSTVGRRVVLSLGGRSPLLPAGFLVPGGTPDCGPQARAFAYGALTLCRAPSHASSARHVLCDCGRAVRGPVAASSTPGRQRPHALRAPRFGLAPVRSPLLGGSLLDFLSSGYLDVSVPPVASRSRG